MSRAVQFATVEQTVAHYTSLFLALRRHRIAQGARLPGQPLDLRRSSDRLAILVTDVADGFKVREHFIEEGEQFRQHV
jgi:hypothetical protein